MSIPALISWVVNRRLLTPPEDSRDQCARVVFAETRDIQLLEGRDAAEGVLKRGPGCEVAVDGIMLLVGGALGQGPDDTLDFSGCGGGSIGLVARLCMWFAG